MHVKMTDYLVTLFTLQSDTKQALGHITPKLALKMFDTCILPVLEYNCELWSSHKPVNNLEKVQLGYLKNMLGVRRQTSSQAVYSETGRFPLHVQQQFGIINYWIKLEKLPANNILKKCLNEQKEINTSGNNAWVAKIIHILNEHYPQRDHLRLANNELESIIKTFKSKIYDKCQDTILAEINDSTLQPKLRTYKLFKTDYRLEPYLLLNLSRKMYNKIARFRVSSHNLRIETGRHENPILPAAERLCLKCSMHEIEDEKHCLIVCPHNKLSREELLKVANDYIDNFEQLISEDRFKTIMKSKEPELLKSLGKFLVNVDA